MRKGLFLLPLISATLTLATTAVPAAGEIYRWVDEDGVVHFGERAEGATNAELVDIQTAPRAPAATAPSTAPASADEEPQPSYAQQRRDARAEARRQAAEERQHVDATCAQARKRVEMLEPSTKVLVEGEDGSVTRLDDVKRLALLDEARQYIDQNCKR